MCVVFSLTTLTCLGAVLGASFTLQQYSYNEICHESLPPSSVKVILLTRGPYPAEVLALIDTLYGMCLSTKIIRVKLKT